MKQRVLLQIALGVIAGSCIASEIEPAEATPASTNAVEAVEVSAPKHTHPHTGPGSDKMGSQIIPQEYLDKLQFGFLVEVEAFAGQTGSASESDITLATVELVVDADIVEGVSAHVGLLWEEDDTETNNLDEAYLRFGDTESIPFYATIGRMYLPFGNFQSAFISDPLTLEMAEINQSAALLGYNNEWVDVNLGAFNGNYEEGTAAGDEKTRVEDLFASVTFHPIESVSFGAYWLSDLFETDGFADYSDELMGTSDYSEVGGAGAFINMQFGPVSVNAEYVTGLQKVDATAGDILPMSYNVEASMPILEKLSGGIKFEGSDDFYGSYNGGALADKFADWQSGLVLSYSFNKYVTLSGEYMHAHGLDNSENGDILTAQIAMGF